MPDSTLLHAILLASDLLSGVAHIRPQTAAAATIVINAMERIEEADTGKSQNSFRHDPEKDPAVGTTRTAMFLEKITMTCQYVLLYHSHIYGLPGCQSVRLKKLATVYLCTARIVTSLPGPCVGILLSPSGV